MSEQGFAPMAELDPMVDASNITAPSPDEVARARAVRGRLPVVSMLDLTKGMIGWAVFGAVFLAYMRTDAASVARSWLLALWLGVLVMNIVLGPPAQVRERERVVWPWVVLVGAIVLARILGPTIWPGWEESTWMNWFQFSFALIVLMQLVWLIVSAMRWHPVDASHGQGVLRSSPALAVLLATDGVTRAGPQGIADVLGMHRSAVDRWLLALKNGGLVSRVGMGRWQAFVITKRGRKVLDEFLGTP